MGGEGSGGHNEGAEPIDVSTWTKRALSTAGGKLRLVNELRQFCAQATNHTELNKAAELRRALTAAIAIVDKERDFGLRERELAFAQRADSEGEYDEDIVPPLAPGAAGAH